jgi:hypothetical protein
MYEKKHNTKQIEAALKAKKDRQEKEMEECTFKPIVNKKTASSRSRGTSNDLQPKGFNRTISRMRKNLYDKELKKLEEKKLLTGERYDRDVLEKMKPPSFLSKVTEKKKVLLSIEVSITPTRSGKIAIKEGDDVNKIAVNFCKAYSLGKEMQMALSNQLETHLKNYYKQQMLNKILDKTFKRAEASQTLEETQF